MNFDCDFSEFVPAAANTASLPQAMEIVTGAEDAVESLDAFGRVRRNGWLKASGKDGKLTDGRFTFPVLSFFLLLYQGRWQFWLLP